MLEENRFENLLKSLRVRKGKVWTQAKTAKLLGVSLRAYVGWENGESLPSHRDLKNITAMFELNDADTEILFRAAGQPAPKIQNLPFPPNPLFTGRKALLGDLDQLFKKHDSVAITQPLSISGLGGIGKTQLALEYAHRSYPNVYRCVLWVNAADKITLEAGYLSLARLLELREKDEREVDRVVQAVKMWLEEHTGWLLILDNADDLQLARSFLPTKPRGHVLLTTRSQIVGNIARRIEVEAMEPEEGLLFLLRRSGVLKGEAKPDTLASDVHSAVRQLVEILGGHPLALDQAGAYIEETESSFAEYMQHYADQRLILLNRRGWPRDEHPETVVITFEISFQRAYKLFPVAADVLHFCAFLHPDDIPEELFSQNDGLTLSIPMLNEAIAALRRYSLIKRHVEKKLLSVHRLVQAVLQDTLDAETKKQWMKRAVLAVEAVFPDVEFAQWTACERYLPHALVCYTWIEQEEDIAAPEAAHLLRQTAQYLLERARYVEAEPLFRRALSIREQQLGPQHFYTADSLNGLAGLYRDQGKYVEAEPLYTRALSINEQQLGPQHLETATNLNNLAGLYRAQGKYAEAEPLFQRALSIREQQLGPQHPRTAQSLNNLAALHEKQGKYAEAEPLFQRALSIEILVLGLEHPETAQTLNNLAYVYKMQGKYEQAEPLFQQALSIREQLLGPHPDTAQTLNNLATLYCDQGKYEQAESLFQRALSIKEQLLGIMHPSVALSLNNLAELYRAQGKYAEAEPLFQRALAIDTNAYGADHLEIATDLNNLAGLYYDQGKYVEAEPLYQRALSIREQQLGPQHPHTEQSLNNLAALYKMQGKYAQTELLYKQILSIREQLLGPEHPDVAQTLNNLAAFYYAQGKYAEAEPLFQRALAIDTNAYGADHLEIATDLNNLAELYRVQGKYAEAEPLLERALSIIEQQLGPEHPQTRLMMHNYLVLLSEILTGGDLEALLQLLAQDGR